MRNYILKSIYLMFMTQVPNLLGRNVSYGNFLYQKYHPCSVVLFEN